MALLRRGERLSSNVTLIHVHHEFGPTSADRNVPGKAIYRLEHVLKPLFELSPLTSVRK
jgi:hypothetical protein